MGVLSTIGIVSFAGVQATARDSQRSSKMTIISEALEKYYSQHGEYPSCNAMSQSASTVVANTLVGADSTNLTTPSSTSGTNSFATPATISCDPSITTLTSDVFAYVGVGDINDPNNPCLNKSGPTSACLQYTLKYREESTGNTISLVSRHTIPTLTTPSAPTTAVTLNGSNVLATITPVTCPAGSITQYGIRNSVNGGSWSSYTAWDTITTATQAVSQGVKYEYQSQARCYPDGSATSVSLAATGAISNPPYINPIATIPTVPGVTTNTAGSTTTWSWPASTGCATGTSVRYHYDYTTSYGYDSGWVVTGGTSVGFDTSSTGYTYTVTVQSQCYSANTSSSWSGSDSDSYYRPVITYTLTTIAGTGGTVSAGGTYNAGSTPTITATPNANYSFSSWSGDTGCSGVASHTITMDANKSCTANFTPTVIGVPPVPSVAANTSGATTTWSWGATSCPGNTARYQYDYTISSGYDSGWAATGGTSVAFTTSTEGYTYTVNVQSQCYNAVTSSSWSGSGSAGYYRAYTPPTVAIAASPTSITAGQNTTLTLTSNKDVGPTPYYLKIYNQTTGVYLASTGGGTTLSYTDTPATTQTYVARATDSTGNTVYSSSSAVTVTVTAAFIAAPAAPVVTASTSSSTTTWSWNAASCPGNTARYQYDYTTSYGYDSGWVATGGTSVAFTTSSEGYTYTVTVQAQCYNAVTSSSWSGSGSASYYRPVTVTNYTLTNAAGTGGSVSSGGTYTAGSTPTITATPNANYSFSSWSGSTGCSGVASHTITMDANKSCTANFVVSLYYYNKYNALDYHIDSYHAVQKIGGNSYQDTMYSTYSFDMFANTYSVSAGYLGTISWSTAKASGLRYYRHMTGDGTSNLIYMSSYVVSSDCGTNEWWFAEQYSAYNPIGKMIGSLVQSNIIAPNGTYPTNGLHTDGYWYVKGALAN